MNVDNRLLTIPPEFENFQALHDDLQRRVAPTDLELEDGESLRERLRAHLPQREEDEED